MFDQFQRRFEGARQEMVRESERVPLLQSFQRGTYAKIDVASIAEGADLSIIVSGFNGEIEGDIICLSASIILDEKSLSSLSEWPKGDRFEIHLHQPTGRVKSVLVAEATDHSAPVASMFPHDESGQQDMIAFVDQIFAAIRSRGIIGEEDPI